MHVLPTFSLRITSGFSSECVAVSLENTCQNISQSAAYCKASVALGLWESFELWQTEHQGAPGSRRGDEERVGRTPKSLCRTVIMKEKNKLKIRVKMKIYSLIQIISIAELQLLTYRINQILFISLQIFKLLSFNLHTYLSLVHVKLRIKNIYSTSFFLLPSFYKLSPCH